LVGSAFLILTHICGAFKEAKTNWNCLGSTQWLCYNPLIM
jgi:hypothetical protein